MDAAIGWRQGFLEGSGVTGTRSLVLEGELQDKVGLGGQFSEWMDGKGRKAGGVTDRR